MTEEIISQAAHNNAVWCDAVCSTHFCRGEFHPSCWLNRHVVPEYYPDLVTSTGPADIALQTEALAKPMHDAAGKSLAVKDSFNCLSLLATGFTRLFSAEWVSAAAAGVTGVSNVFASRIATEVVLQGPAKVAAARFPRLAMVGYESEDDLAAARKVGFRTVGHLRIWRRTADANG